MKKGNNYYNYFFVTLFLVVWIWAAINPLSREGWLNENYIVFLVAPVIIYLVVHFKLSNTSSALITAFMCLHVVGSHYTYLETPFGFVLQNWLGAQRNMYDRFLHFLFGLLFYFPIREIFMKIGKTNEFWNHILPLDVVLSLSAFFEILEFMVVLFIRPESRELFIGFQFDCWDTTKDILNAFVGAIISLITIILIRLFKKRTKDN